MSSSEAAPSAVKASSPRPSGDEETLPLYAEFDHNQDADSIKFPEDSASPDDVRDFLMSTIAATRRVTADHARRIVSKWNTGSGKELKSYSAAMYLNIFGIEDGWLVYKEVMMRLEESRKPDATSLKAWVLIILCFVACDVGLVLGAVFVKSDGWRVVLVIAAAFLGIFCIIMMGAACEGEKSKEKAIEGKLSTAVDGMLTRSAPNNASASS